MTRIFLIAFIFIGTAPCVLGAQILKLTYGIPNDSILPQTAKMPNWCWSATVSSALRYFGIKISQTEIVRILFEEVVDRPADEHDVMKVMGDINVKHPSVKAERVKHRKEFKLKIIEYTAQQLPILVGLDMLMERDGHAVLLTQMEYTIGKNGRIVPLSVTVADPSYEKNHFYKIPWPDFIDRCFAVIVFSRT